MEIRCCMYAFVYMTKNNIEFCESFLIRNLCVCRCPVWGAAFAVREEVWSNLESPWNSPMWPLDSPSVNPALGKGQALGKGLEQVASIYNSNNIYHANDLKGQFIICRDNAKNTLYLKMGSLKSEDTATYYSAGYTVSECYCDLRHKPPCKVLKTSRQHWAHRALGHGGTCSERHREMDSSVSGLPLHMTFRDSLYGYSV